MYTHERGREERRGSGSGGLNGANSDSVCVCVHLALLQVSSGQWRREGEYEEGRRGSRQHLSVSRKAAVMCVPSKHQSDTAQFQLRSLSSQPHSLLSPFNSVWSSVAIHLPQLCPSTLDCQLHLPVCKIPCNALPLHRGKPKKRTRVGFGDCRVST